MIELLLIMNSFLENVLGVLKPSNGVVAELTPFKQCQYIEFNVFVIEVALFPVPGNHY